MSARVMRKPSVYRRRPERVEAIRYQPGPRGNCKAVAAFLEDEPPNCMDDCADDPYWVTTSVGDHAYAEPGDWIVIGTNWSIDVLTDQEFHDRYEPEGENDG